MSWRVFIDFDYNFDWVFDFTTTGDEITPYVKDGQGQIGAANEMQLTASVGTATLKLNNTDLRWNTLNASGPYYGKLMARKPVKIVWDQSGVIYPVMLGFIKDIQPDGGVQGQSVTSEATMVIEDIMAQLQGNIALPIQQSQTAEYLIKLAINAALYAPVATNSLQTQGTIQFNDQINVNGVIATFVNTLSATPNQVLLGARDDDTLANFTAWVNGAEGVGTVYSAGSTKPPNATASFSPSLPARVRMWHRDSIVLTGNAIATTVDATQPYFYFAKQNASANGDSFTNSFWMQAGLYSLNVLGVTGPSSGKIDWYFDNVLVVSGQDWYSAGTTKNVIKTASGIVTLAVSGYHVLKGVVNGKNASSSGFDMQLTKYWILYP